MKQYATMIYIHFVFIFLTILLFNIRYWLLAINPKRNIPKFLKIMPPINDTLLLISGFLLIWITHSNPFTNANWLGIKIILLIGYIYFGVKTFKSEPKSKHAIGYYILSMACIVGMIILSFTKPF